MENKLIAEFMGREYVDENLIEFKNFSAYKTITLDENGHPDDIVYTDCFDPDNELEYHTSWDWLMPVVDKIEDIKGVYRKSSITNGGQLYNSSNKYLCEIGHDDRVVAFIYDEKRINAEYKAVIEFINYYNRENDNKV